VPRVRSNQFQSQAARSGCNQPNTLPPNADAPGCGLAINERAFADEAKVVFDVRALTNKSGQDTRFGRVGCSARQACQIKAAGTRFRYRSWYNRSARKSRGIKAMPLSDRLWLALRAAPAISLGDAFWYGLFLNTSTHHAMHHEAFRANYGLYFNIWDRLLGTNHPQYEQRFAAVTGPSVEAEKNGVRVR
jgi:hypothetical protein